MIFSIDETRYKLHFLYTIQESEKGKQRVTTAVLSIDDPLTKAWVEVARAGAVCSIKDRFERAVGRFLAYHRLYQELKRSEMFTREFLKGIYREFHETVNLPKRPNKLLAEYFPLQIGIER